MPRNPFTFPRRHLLSALPAGVAASALPRSAPADESVRFQVNDDGTFDLHFGSLALERAYPALDDEALRPLTLEVQRSGETTAVSYRLAQGSVRLTLGKEAAAVWLQLELQGFANAPHWIFPLANAHVVGADRFFKQGFGFGGPSGIFPIARAGNNHSPNRPVEVAWSYDSFLNTALVAKDGRAILVGALEHRNFLQRSTIYNRTHRRELVEKRSAWDEAYFEAGFSTENIPLENGRLVLPRLYLHGGSELQTTLDRFAERLASANKVQIRTPPRLHWDSWYEFFEGHDAARLQDTLEGFAQVKPAIPFQSVLIDAGFSSAGDWLHADERLYPGGLKATFSRIAAAGHVPGIWVSPFMVSSNSRVYKEHPDWMVKGLDGKPVLHGKGKPFFYIFATEEERYYLDTSHPGAFAWLREVFRTYRSWGVKAYKLDFMEWGFKDSTTIKRHTPGKTSTQHFVDVLRMIKDEIGPDAYFHGCITPFAPMIGFAQSMRVAYDVDTDSWTNDGNTINMFQETMATQHMNNVLWQNDPDVLYVRDGMGTTRMNNDEVYALTLWNGILGGVVSTSDRPHRLAPDRLALLRFVVPGKTLGKARFPLWAAPPTDKPSFFGLVAVRDYPNLSAHAVLLLNQGNTDMEGAVSLADLGVGPKAHVYAWGPGTSKAMGEQRQLQVKLKRHQAALFFVSRKATPPKRGLGISGEVVPGLG